MKQLIANVGTVDLIGIFTGLPAVHVQVPGFGAPTSAVGPSKTGNVAIIICICILSYCLLYIIYLFSF